MHAELDRLTPCVPVCHQQKKEPWQEQDNTRHITDKLRSYGAAK